MVIFMHISIEKLNQIEKQYRDFKKTPCYEERKAHLEFADFARAIIEKLVQKSTMKYVYPQENKSHLLPFPQ